ncbi:MAG TPA: phage holin family protein [Gaiellaceae bacterium]
MAVSARSTANGHHGDLRERGTAELVKQLSNQFSTLVRQEVELAKTEAAEKGKKAGVGAGMLGGAGVAGLLLLGSLTAFLIIVLALAIPAWASALLVTALWAAVAGVLALEGRNKLHEIGKPIPEKTVETVKEDVQWLKNRK